MRVYAVDPGKMTGVAWIDTDHPLSFQSWMLPHMDFLESAWAFLVNSSDDVDLIVCESFIITAQTLKKTRGNWSLEQIGCLRWMCHHQRVEFELQSPADAKGFADNTRLKEVGWYKTGAGHDNDAARHLLLAVARHDSGAFKELIKS